MNDNKKVFDYNSLSKKYGIKSDDLKEIVNEAYKEFKGDEMMAELHIVRAIRHTVSNKRQGALG